MRPRGKPGARPVTNTGWEGRSPKATWGEKSSAISIQQISDLGQTLRLHARGTKQNQQKTQPADPSPDCRTMSQ